MIRPVPREIDVVPPTTVQQERAATLRRFNWLTIYTPVTLATVLSLVLVGLLLYGSLSPNIRGTREFASALADVVIILAILPMLVLCAIVPGGAIAFVIWRQNERGGPRRHGRLQILLWRLEMLVDKVQAGASDILAKVAQPVIAGHARAAYLQAVLRRVKRIFSRN